MKFEMGNKKLMLITGKVSILLTIFYCISQMFFYFTSELKTLTLFLQNIDPTPEMGLILICLTIYMTIQVMMFFFNALRKVYDILDSEMNKPKKEDN